jgi:hypothetical protein
LLLSNRDSKSLGLIHAARGALIVPLPVAVWIQFSYAASQNPWVGRPYSLLALLIVAVVLEFSCATQLIREKLKPSDLYIPLATMILTIVVEFLAATSLGLIDSMILSMHISSVVGLSVIEAGLIILLGRE